MPDGADSRDHFRSVVGHFSRWVGCRSLSVRNFAGQGFRLLNPISDLCGGRQASDQLLTHVDLLKLGVQIFGLALGQLDDCIHPSLFEQIGILRANALDTEQIYVVDPFQDELLADAALLGDLFSPFGSCFSA
jgi:hypothetical protein